MEKRCEKLLKTILLIKKEDRTRILNLLKNAKTEEEQIIFNLLKSKKEEEKEILKKYLKAKGDEGYANLKRILQKGESKVSKKEESIDRVEEEKEAEKLLEELDNL